ncbi:hypothetical protein DPMN_148162 [Dreissena polymorpha]|uniref:Uncharacterized protein n=1 Tax=Dreissena polymorpha TaxID=45954 RepID=A0A9D4FDF8_DREPO|nr:hypothetical protein DPMN_148162 [Dreissena polymorpha]
MRFHAAQINAGFLKGISSTSFGDTASRRILNTSNIIDPYPSNVNDEGDTRYNNPMFKSDATSSQAGTMTVSIFKSTQLCCIHAQEQAKHVECQLLLPTEQELYVSGRGIIDTNCMGIARRQEFE